MHSKNKVHRISLLAIFIALVFIGSIISIQIPVNLGGTPTRIHLGNIFCLLSAFILGPLDGAFAAGTGSALYDLTNPLYISILPFTFLFKFLMAYICGKISYLNNKKALDIKYNILGGILGIFTYLVLHLGRSALGDIFFKNIPAKTALTNFILRLSTSILNAAIAIFLAIPLNLIIKKILQKNRKN